MSRAFFAVALLFVSCLAFTQDAPAKQELKASPGDILRVWFHGQDALSGAYTVLSDGHITVPRIGRIRAEGRTLKQIESDVFKEAKKFLVDPQISVVFESERQKYVFIAGDNVVAGTVPWNPGFTVRQLLANVVVNGNSSDLSVTLYRNGKKLSDINLKEILTADSTSQNIELEPGDLLSVFTNKSNAVYVLGSVASPGRFLVTTGTTIDQAIAVAGGTVPGTFEPKELTVQVRRNGQITTVPAIAGSDELAAPIEPGDVIVVNKPEQIKVTLAGEITYARDQYMATGTSAFQAVQAAGGPRASGTLRNVMLYRNGEVITLDLTASPESQIKEGLVLQNNDFLYIPENRHQFYVLGNVVRPGAHLIEDNKSPTIVDAIAESGGLTDQGTFRDIVIARPGADGRLQINRYNVDQFFKDGKLDQNPLIKPGDVVYVRETRGFNLAQVTQAISSALFLERLFR